MHYNFLFNGCSFTAGGELEGPNKDLEYQRTHRFSHLVGEHYNKTYNNISKGGKSNDWIVENTINWFEEGNTCDIAIIQFTIKLRTILYDKTEKEYDIIKPVSIGSPIWKHSIEKKISNNITLANNFYKQIYTDYYGHQNYYKNLFLMSKYLKYRNINTIFLTLDTSQQKYSRGYELHCSDIKIEPISGSIIPNRIENKSFYCKDYASISKDYSYWLNGTHPNELGHQKIAEYLISEIDKNQYLV